ncbi:MAG: hypothetical protein K5888_10790 [Lachnospiraceae bacterium]|nr:hypothetical protein [Lachnospiraceae bacterium]
MNVNGVTGVNAYSAYQAGAEYTKKETQKAASSPDNSVAAVYERSSSDQEVVSESSKKTYAPNEDLIAKMKADSEQRTAQLKSLVEKIILHQADKGSSIFEILGREYSAEDIAKAKEDISEDGYWGVKQTSQRILDFAVALTGGDPDKIEEMRSAFEKGYKMAEKTWGGELPDICKQTYEAVFAGFDKMAEEAGL